MKTTTFERLPSRCRAVAALALAAAGLAAFAASSRAADVCMATSAATITPLVELYTSEGCSSCPPADRWLSALKADPDLVALAFHVDYWDRLGWKDRFSSAAFTARQAEQLRGNGARFSYTPQVVIDGRDRPDWPRIGKPAAARGEASVRLTLSRRGDHVAATVLPLPRAPHRLAAYWAVTEQGFVSQVEAGENRGATLHHDFVVREYRPVAAWQATPGTATTLSFDLAGAPDRGHARQVDLVVTDADSGRPVQALKLGC